MPKDPRESRDDSRIRGIINKINQGRPSLEKTREILVSEDGSKLTKVVKKRRVVLSDKDKRRGVYLRYIIASGAGLALLLVLFIYYILQWANITGSDYLTAQSDSLRQSLHAQSVEWKGASIKGFHLNADKLSLRYPENSLIESIELTELQGDFSAASVFSRQLNFKELQVGEIKLKLRQGMEAMQLPDIDMSEIGGIDRIICNSFNVSVAGEDSPFSLEQSQAYLYYPEGDRDRALLSINSGKLTFSGWTSFDIKDIRLIFTPQHCELHAQLVQHAQRTLKGTEGGGSLELYQKIGEGTSLYGPYQFLSHKLDLAYLTDSRMKAFIQAQTQKQPHETLRESRANITFSPEGKAPSIIADLNLAQVEWSSLPALKQIQQHIERSKRDYYKKPSIASGKMRIESRPQTIHLSMREGDMMEPHKMSISGIIHLDTSNTLSGNLDYALPIELTRVEYPDNISDPLFTEHGTQAKLQTQLKGFAFIPDDNSRELENLAQQARQQRPKANNIDYISIESMYQATQDTETEQHQESK